LVVVTVLSHCRTGEAKVESHASSKEQPALLLDTTQIQPGSQPHLCVRGNTVPLATWTACTDPGPPQEPLVHNETRISLLAKPSLTQMTLCQLCTTPWTSQSRLAATGLEPRISGGKASALDHCTTREASTMADHCWTLKQVETFQHEEGLGGNFQ
jgi:hypothetical protein